MPQRRRYATRDELITMLAEHVNINTSDTINETSVAAVLDALEEHGVSHESLVKVSVVEDVAPDLQ